MSETEAVGRRHGRRERGGQRVAQSPYRRPRLTFPRTPGVSEDELEAIHDASLTVLEEIGMDLLLPEARDDPEARRAPSVEGGERVRFDRGLV